VTSAAISPFPARSRTPAPEFPATFYLRSFGRNPPLNTVSTATLTVSSTGTHSLNASPRTPSAPLFGGVALASLFLLVLPRRSRRLPRLALLPLALLLFFPTGCGLERYAAIPTSVDAGTTTGPYTVTVKATSGSFSASTLLSPSNKKAAASGGVATRKTRSPI